VELKKDEIIAVAFTSFVHVIDLVAVESYEFTEARLLTADTEPKVS
jgi:hypothetical protein